ncbi:DUF3823 domain-containing protein [Dysgonomonas sp. Marseille-P4677]|uniref:DUF3823 domain-containing protein n=1 Tax=Dysgonomonas sp. Marseille-P4677 TaxID=2364790 RepID=UPI0019134D24|nr:DUF3823 domain-containing protein [Dysgonomonas sp. Marseille-P4677]MBK5722513.1 DUF3823 domain-containing protein [Dysgonomonas sp. Marseille-P4677]
MKKYILGVFALSSLLFSSCEKDNYDEPKSDLIGKIISQTSKEAVGVRQTEGAVQMQLWQDGYELHTSIPVYVNQDGTFSAKLFDGTYKLVSRDNNGPWINSRDTILVTVKGNTTIEYPVKPYFMLSDENFTLNGNTLTATFNIKQENAIQDRNIERVTLYVNNTVFVDDNFKKLNKNATTPAIGSNTISMDISNISSNIALYARVGVKISGVEQLLYTAGSVRIK